MTLSPRFRCSSAAVFAWIGKTSATQCSSKVTPFALHSMGISKWDHRTIPLKQLGESLCLRPAAAATAGGRYWEGCGPTFEQGRADQLMDAVGKRLQKGSNEQVVRV